MIRLGEWGVQTVEEVILDGLPPDTLIKDLSRYRSTTIYGMDPGMLASAWLPNGTIIEYTFTRATALFEPVKDIDVRRDVKWYVFDIHYNDIWWLKPVGVRYGLRITVKSDDRPVLDFNCLQPIKQDVYKATCPGSTSTVYLVDVYFMYAWTGERKLCIFAESFNAGEYVAGRRGTAVLLDYCRPAERPPRNITAVVSPWGGRQSRLDIYVDGASFDTIWIDGPNAKLYVGPYELTPTMSMHVETAAYVDLNYPGVVQKPLGSALLLIGNDTVMAPPRYVLKEKGWAFTQARVELTYDQGVTVLPGRTYDNSTVYTWPVVPVKIHGRLAELPYKALVNAAKLCPGGAVVSGRYSWVGGWVEVRGPTSIHCAEYPVEFLLPNGTSAAASALFNKTFFWTPPPIVYPNGTRLEADPVSVFVDGPKAVRVNYTRVYYLVRVVTPFGLNETWAPRGAVASAPAVIRLGNGTRWVAEGPTSAVAERPLVLAPRYKRQYLVRLEAPVNSTEVWVDAGSSYAVGLPDPWDLPNGTRFAGLLINGTALREFRVDKPMTLRAQYAEVYYWAVVETPINKTVSWMPKGAVLKFPDIINFGNGTRLVGPSVREAVVDRPVALKVEYAKRQHYVKIVGVEEWEGWADAGAVIRLNATVVGGVEYTPAEVVTASNPGVYKPLFYAVYRTVARDVLGVPNPLATVKLCNATASPLPDGSAVVAAYTRELC
ncbi:MAG: thermopsin-like protease [Pyrobaculum sp.]